MHCPECHGKIEVIRRCRQVRLRCRHCAREFAVHELASRLDKETEAILEGYTCIIYD